MSRHLDGVSQSVTGKDTIMYGGKEAKRIFGMLRHVNGEVQQQLCGASYQSNRQESLFVEKAIVKVQLPQAEPEKFSTLPAFNASTKVQAKNFEEHKDSYTAFGNPRTVTRAGQGQLK